MEQICRIIFTATSQRKLPLKNPLYLVFQIRQSLSYLVSQFFPTVGTAVFSFLYSTYKGCSLQNKALSLTFDSMPYLKSWNEKPRLFPLYFFHKLKKLLEWDELLWKAFYQKRSSAAWSSSPLISSWANEVCRDASSSPLSTVIQTAVAAVLTKPELIIQQWKPSKSLRCTSKVINIISLIWSFLLFVSNKTAYAKKDTGNLHCWKQSENIYYWALFYQV